MSYLLDVTIVGAPNNSANWLGLVVSVGPILVGVVAILFNYKSTKKSIAANRENIDNTLKMNRDTTDKTLQRKKIEDRRAEIYKMLNDLYGPLSILKDKSTLLYEKFKIGKAPNAPNNRFSALLYLLNEGGPQNLSDNDKTLLAEIIKIGRQCERLIQNKAGLIDDEELRNKLFPLLSKHYLIIRLAYNGALKGQVQLFEDSMFPESVDARIKDKITSLQTELKDLN